MFGRKELEEWAEDIKKADIARRKRILRELTEYTLMLLGIATLSGIVTLFTSGKANEAAMAILTIFGGVGIFSAVSCLVIWLIDRVK